MKKAIPITVLLISLATLYPLQQWIDRTTPREVISEETLYFASGNAVKRMSLGLDGLAADIYWIRAVQYFGRKLIDSGVPFSAAASKGLRMDMLAPLLNIIVTLDPQHMPAYRFGAIFLPERDLPAAIALLEKGIDSNPNDWRLYQDLGYIYWQAGNGVESDEQARYYAKAAEWYERGSQVPGAMWWMRDLAGYMKIAGGSREAAYAIYSSYLNSDDEKIRAQAVLRMKQLRSLDEMDAINGVLAEYKKATGECPTDLRVLAPRLRALKLALNDEQWPWDPDHYPYVLETQSCTVRIGPGSTVPR
jgi:tetratricopeptide (TPR) repeat protein